jgi:transposase
MNLKTYFSKPAAPRQRQYEAIRAIVMGNLPVADAAKKYKYTLSTLYTFLRDAKSGKLKLFPQTTLGPTKRRTPDNLQKMIVKKRKLNMSANEIRDDLIAANIKISASTVERILADANFSKLPRRTNAELGNTVRNQIISRRATPIDFDNLKPFHFDCPTIGIFFFLPYIIESGIIDIAQKCNLPKSSSINAGQACLSMLLLKLIGSERLSHIKTYDHEPGFGMFAGLNVLPKASYMATYSCRTSEKILFDLQKKIVAHFKDIYPNFYQSKFINLDFHSVPHFGDQSQMEKVWCGARGKSMKGANTIFAQDSESNMILYTNADILRKNETKEILHFVNYWKSVKGNVNETLVFDCKLTKYSVLDELHEDKVKFITLRKRNEKLLLETAQIPDDKWQKAYLPIPKRKHKAFMVYETDIVLEKCKTTLRQIIIKNHGRVEPTFVITNNRELPLKEVLMVYAKRWHIENKLAELVSFFNLNALSSPLMIRIHFDIIWTIIADTFYHRLAQDLPRFERERANSIFRKFINIPGQIVYDGDKFTIKIRKRAHTPILLGMEKLQNGFSVPWLNNKLVKIEWTA